MSTIYITDQGATVTKIDGRIVVRKGRMVLRDIPVVNVEQIVVFGNAAFTTPAIKFVLENGIDVAYLSSRGRYRGRFQPELTGHARLRRAQYEKSNDPSFKLDLSKKFVDGKIRNMLALCRRQRRRRDQEIREQMRMLERFSRKVEHARDLDGLRGYEGAASAAYYRAYRRFLREDLGFVKRSHHPPRDPVNVLLSLGYTLLYNNVRGLINLVGLDPYQGFLHEAKRGHAALASDLMEEWRPLIVDSTVLTMINRQEIGKGAFRWVRGQIRLTEGGLERFLRRYDGRLAAEVFYPRLKIRTSYRRSLELQVRALADLLLGKSEEYRPFSTR